MFGFPYPIMHWIVRYGIGLIIFALIVRIIALWIGLDERYSFIRFLARLTDPFLDPVRKIVRPVMRIDFSFLIASFLLYTLMVVILQALPDQW
jgi:uncharacterized protein YggT (Ycf19 family)